MLEIAILAINKNSTLMLTCRRKNSITKSNASKINKKEYSNTSYHDNQRTNGFENNVLVNPMCQQW